MSQRSRVILMIESSRAYGRGCLRGIAAYARAHGPWSFLHIERGLNETLPRGLKKWRGDGIIARIENRAMARALERLNLPIIDLRGRQLLPGIISLDTDHAAAARMAAMHFLDRGFRHLAFCGLPGIDFSDAREQAMAEFLHQRRASLHRYGRDHGAMDAVSVRRQSSVDTIAHELRGSLDHADLVRWLCSLPLPVGIMACNDARGRQVLDACVDAHLRVPEEAAVVGVDNDAVLCELADPPLSSIAPDVEQIGYRAAALLDEILRGGEPAPRVYTIPPRGLITRPSSDILAIEDPIVAEAMHLIRENAATHFNVESLLDRMTISRATLERRFAKVMGRSPKQEILQTRLTRVKQLLEETDYPLATIADMSGFKTPAHLSVAFKARFGHPPGQTRARSL